MTKDQAIEQAIKLIQGQPMFAGQIVAHPSYDKACELREYQGSDAILFDGEVEHRFPRSEIFDPKKVINVANHLLNLGFWKEGMESVVLHVAIPT